MNVIQVYQGTKSSFTVSASLVDVMLPYYFRVAAVSGKTVNDFSAVAMINFSISILFLFPRFKN